MELDSTLCGYVVREERYESNATLIEEGKAGDWVYVVLEGTVKIKKNTPDGMVTIDTLGEGSIVGEMALLIQSNRQRTASIIAEGPVKVGLLDRVRLEREYEALSPQLKDLIKTLGLRLAETTKKASLLAISLKKQGKDR